MGTDDLGHAIGKTGEVAWKLVLGRCEVVTFTPQHTGSFSGLTETRARTVVEAWAHRTAALSAAAEDGASGRVNSD